MEVVVSHVCSSLDKLLDERVGMFVDALDPDRDGAETVISDLDSDVGSRASSEESSHDSDSYVLLVDVVSWCCVNRRAPILSLTHVSRRILFGFCVAWLVLCPLGDVYCRSLAPPHAHCGLQ